MSARTKQILLWICGLVSSLYGLGLIVIGVPMMVNYLHGRAWETSSWPFVLVSGLVLLVSGLGALFGGGKWTGPLLISHGLYLAAVSYFVRDQFISVAVTPLGAILLVLPAMEAVILGLMIFRTEKAL